MIQDTGKTTEEENSDIADRKGSASMDSERKKKVVIEAEGVPVHYTRDVGNMIISIISGKVHHVNVYEEAAYFSKNVR